MKKIARIVGLVVVTLIILAGLAFTAVYFMTEAKRSSHVAVEVKAIPIPTDSASIEEGKRLVGMKSCADCHGVDYAGATPVDDPAIGKFSGANLTASEGSATAHYKDEDWVRSIRYGVSPAGRPLIFMPSMDFTGISDEDLGKMIAYLKSLPKVDRLQPKIQIGPFGRILSIAGQMPILFPYENVKRDLKIATSVKAEASEEYGAYLAQSCAGCHGDHFSGGDVPGVPPDWPKAGNLTPSGRIHDWTLAQFETVLREGKTPDGRQLDSQYMPWKSFSLMNDVELEALYKFLKTLPAREAGTH